MVQEFTHLLPKEIAIWHKFLAQYAYLFTSFDYDVHLGPGAELPEDTPEWVVKQSQAVSRDRVDVVGHTETNIWIIEIKPRGGKGAIGQLLQYERFYLEELQPSKPLFKVLVCERLAPGIRETCQAQGISIYLV